ncbi:MAG: Rieske 2Fe-2S domain-containing protein, partial [Actinobacteria bacterium]|nr:Rieske 2Fe-2S domain-containing protein [Actinomycetota bacterium]
MFVLNAWYVAAWTVEVKREPLRKVICEIPVVLYRKLDGTAVALEDRCAHRGYPLSAGRVVEDVLECGYHGFQFDCSGVC